MAQFHMGACRHCGQRVIRRGTRVLNVHGTPIDHTLSCTGQPQAPDDEKSAGSTSTSTRGDAA